ncbi:MFS transporter [Bacillus testis]|uniref:MFS transporter n=1 Tax=Bacillus testis TaxID=1622072 RepID=UPI00067F5C1B|nr:MFS transporter [Bacillus testis]
MKNKGRAASGRKDSIYHDRRFLYILAANIASAIGSGITMIALPWLLISKQDGSQLFGYVSLILTIISFLITPYIGKLVDAISRKKLLMYGEATGLLIIGSFALLGWAGMDYQTWHYVAIIFAGNLYNTLFYPTIFAFTQEVFPEKMYKSLNGAMEVQGQFSSMVAGGIGGIIMSSWKLEYILCLDAATYAAAIFFFLKVNYRKKAMVSPTGQRKATLKEGFSFLLKSPVLFVFLLASYMPFVGVMVTNYLFPVYLKETLHAGAWAYGVEGMVYSIGAVAAGLVIPVLLLKAREEKVMAGGVWCYFLAIGFILFANLPSYLILMFFIALGNAGTRVARNTFIMKAVPNAIIGRVDSIFRLIGLLLRILLIGVFTKMVSVGFISFCFVILASIMFLASVAVWRSGKAMEGQAGKTTMAVQQPNL